jgi:antitoxin component of RelBE/YafQ-DinJ toxin-antitoxin module
MKEDIHVRVDEKVTARVRAWAGRRGLTLAAAITVLLDKALEGDQP